MNVFEITLDVDKRDNKECVYLRQGDVNGTTILAHLRDHDVPMEGGEYTGAFCMTLPDRKNYYWTEATYADGIVTVVVDERIAAQVPGATRNAYFELYDGEELKYTTASFLVRIKAAAPEGQAAHSYDLRVEALMDEMRDIMEEGAAAEEERETTEAERVSAESERAAAFEESEASRQEAFEANEEARQNTFESNEQQRQVDFEESKQAWRDTIAAFTLPTVSVEETETGQVAHITWSDEDGEHVNDMVIDDAINVTMTGDTFSIPVDVNGRCTESGVARFYFAGWVGDRKVTCTAQATTTPDARFSVTIVPSNANEDGVVRIEYNKGTIYPAQVDVCALSLLCGGRTFIHRITAVAPRGGVGASGYSPTVEISDSETGYTVTVTDANGAHAYEVPTLLGLIATSEGATAEHQYVTDSYLVFGGKLYRTTAAIAIGDAIVPDTNVVETTVMDELVSRLP